MIQDKDWIDRMIDRFGEWLDSLTEKDEANNHNKWSYSIRENKKDAN